MLGSYDFDYFCREGLDGNGTVARSTVVYCMSYITRCGANQPVSCFLSVSSDLSWPSPACCSSGWWRMVSCPGVSLVRVTAYSSLGERTGLAELRLKQMASAGSTVTVCPSCQMSSHKYSNVHKMLIYCTYKRFSEGQGDSESNSSG